MLGAAGVGIGDAGVAGMPGAAGMMIPGGMKGCPVPQWGPVRQRCPAEPGGMRGCPKGTWGRRGTWGAPGVRVVGVGWVGVWKGPPPPRPGAAPCVCPSDPRGGDWGRFSPGEQPPPAAVGAVAPRGGGGPQSPHAGAPGAAVPWPLARGISRRGGDGTQAGCEGPGWPRPG